jgi:hypothetical protein
MTRCFLPLLSLLLAAFPAIAEDWPAWRGPRGDGTSTETNIPTRWSATENVAWKTPIPGKGHASPVVHGDRIFLTTCIEKEGKRVLFCLDRKIGKPLWERVVLTAKLEEKHRLNSHASSTPATDGRHVWCTFQQDDRMTAVCYTVDGKEVWRQSPGEFHSKHGFCSPPVLFKDLVILNGDQDADAWLVALDKQSGEERWRADRPNKTRSYCPPLILEAAGRTQLVLSGSKCVASYDPHTGKQLWFINGPTEQYVASLVYGGGLFFLTCGYPTHHVMGIRPDGSGDVTETHVAWHHRGGARLISYVPSPIAHGPWFFIVSDEGYASCHDAKTGERLWSQKLGRRHSASLVSAGEHVLFLDDDGNTFVVKAGAKFELIAKNALDEEAYASPAIANGQLFFRTAGHLWCIGKRSSSR